MTHACTPRVVGGLAPMRVAYYSSVGGSTMTAEFHGYKAIACAGYPWRGSAKRRSSLRARAKRRGPVRPGAQRCICTRRGWCGWTEEYRAAEPWPEQCWEGVDKDGDPVLWDLLSEGRTTAEWGACVGG